MTGLKDIFGAGSSGSAASRSEEVTWI